METFHFFHAADGWEAYREGGAGMVTGPHTTSWDALEAIRALHPGAFVTCVHRHLIDQACSGCQRVDHTASGGSDASR
jgi:hypothetical protein